MSPVPVCCLKWRQLAFNLDELSEKNGRILHVGRARNIDLFMRNINDMGSMVSRKHATIIKDRNKYFLHPISKSTNGTYVNERRIRNLVELHDGDIIGFGGPQYVQLQGENKISRNPYVFMFLERDS